MTPTGFVSEFYPSFWWIPAGVLTAALAIKLPTIIRLWADPMLRAVGGLLVLACAVFVFVAPSTIALVNRVTGVPNISAPWVYSLLTAFGGSCLLLIIAWRNGLSDRSAQTVRATRWVVAVYSGVIAALWVLFALADAPVERLRDLDTYYADTPYMREMILLYLLAHTVATVITSGLIWNWVRTDGLDAWLRWGLKFLGVGYAIQLLFDAAKLTAVAARWAGHKLDWLSTGVAPPIACLSAILIAVGFILPHAGQYLHDRWRVRLAHHELRPLYLLMRTANGSGVPFVLRSTPELRLIRRETFIRDVLLPLARHIDDDRRQRSYEAALALGHEPGRAKALASALAIQDAVEARRRPDDGEGGCEPGYDPDTTDLLREIGAVSRALRRTDDLLAVRARTRDGGVRVAVPGAGGPLSEKAERTKDCTDHGDI
ncbi:MAB_1171c family putative transporter [Streptomyces sp. NPDC020996]|uniref:MAB_1171c family putative transporter n=1 Tax=Streptomyces sp. NPDC020996 TaxID=3154791 RepID=UPI0033F30233